MRLWRLFGGCLALLCFLLALETNALAAVRADFRADVFYQEGSKKFQPCGMAWASGVCIRLDVQLGKAGTFSLILDEKAKRLSILSQNLKAYVEIPASGDVHDWRDLLKSTLAAGLPQNMGLISAEEVERTPLGRASWKGYAVKKSRSVFQISFMGTVHRLVMEIWENEAFAPLPLKVSVDETKDAYASSAWLDNITAGQSADAIFQIPGDFTLYPSVLDMLLYTISQS